MKFKFCALLCGLTLTTWLGFAQVPGGPSQTPADQRDLRFEQAGTSPSDDSASIKIPRGYAVVIGINSYEKIVESQQLQFAERDAEAIYSILISPEGGNFRAENVHKLIGRKATRENVIKELEEWLPSVAKEEDRVLVYFAGHGFVSENKAYLAPYDLNPRDIDRTGYSMAQLGSLFGTRIKAKWKVLLTDACHSGAINPEGNLQTINKSLIDLNKSLFSLTASRDREGSFESPDWGGGHGIFTYYVIKGLEGSADENRDGLVTADELAEYVRQNVRMATSGKQNPTSDRASFDPNMLLAYVASNRLPDNPPPAKFGTLVFESNLDGVEVFLDEKSAGVVDRDKPLRKQGLVPGVHIIRGVKLGYEPDGPREEIVYPGQESTVSIKILIPRRRSNQAAKLFDEGLKFYIKGSEANYRKAVDSFREALSLDSKFSQAALYLARSYNALFEQTKAKEYFQKAIEIDPDYLEARASFGGMLLDIGDLDGAIRQLNAVIQRDHDHAQAYYLLAEAFRRKDSYEESIAAAQHAIQLTPENAEAHLWLAESLRMKKSYVDAKTAYLDYLRLSDFDSKLTGNLNYYALGFLLGLGKRHRAAQHDIWEDLRSLAYFGLCDCDRLLGQFAGAIAYCQKSLSYDRQDPLVHYAIALAYARQAEASGRVETLIPALKHFKAVLEINSNITEASYSRQNIESIEALLFTSASR
jgi:tetratricopeptide (TPR) repeat protein